MAFPLLYVSACEVFVMLSSIKLHFTDDNRIHNSVGVRTVSTVLPM